MAQYHRRHHTLYKCICVFVSMYELVSSFNTAKLEISHCFSVFFSSLVFSLFPEMEQIQRRRNGIEKSIIFRAKREYVYTYSGISFHCHFDSMSPSAGITTSALLLLMLLLMLWNDTILAFLYIHYVSSVYMCVHVADVGWLLLYFYFFLSFFLSFLAYICIFGKLLTALLKR